MGRSARIGGWEVDAETMEMLWTDVLFDIYEVPRGEQPSWAKAVDFFHPQDRPKHRAAVQTGKAWDLELRVITANGNPIHVQTIGQPQIQDGKVVKWWGSIQDITPYVQAEEATRAALADTETTLGYLAEAQRLGKIGTWTRDLRSDERTWSDEHYRIWGVPKKTELSFEVILACVHPDDRVIFSTAFIGTTSNAAPYDLKLRLLVEGAVVWIRAVAKIEFDPDGNAVRAFGYTQDITEQKETADAERAAQAEREVLSNYLEVAQRMGKIGTWDFDLVTNKLFWTDEEYRLFGVSKETELSYDVFRGCVHPDDREFVDAAFQAALSNKAPYGIEHRLLVDGEIIWIKQEAAIEFDSDDNAIRVTGFSQDITEQKKAEESQRAHLVQMETLLESLEIAQRIGRVGTFDVDLVTRETQWTDEMHRIYGVPEDTELNHDVLVGCVHPDDRKLIVEDLPAALAEGQTHSAEYRLLVDGEVVWIRENVTLDFDSDGNPIKMIGFCQDITEQVDSQAALMASQELLAETGRTARIGGWEFDAETQESSWTNTLFDIFEIPRGEGPAPVEGIELFHPDDRQTIDTAFQNALDNGEPYDLEVRLINRKGTTSNVRLIGQPVTVDGKTVKVWGSLQDITDQVRATAALVKSERILTETGRTARIGGWELEAETLEVTWTDVLFDIYEVPMGEQPPLDGTIDLYHPQDRPIISQAVQAGLERGEPWDLELRVVTARGRLIRVRAIGRAEIVDGQTIKLRGSTQDITEHAQLQTALSTSESRFRTILDTAPDSIILLDQFGTVTEWNQSSTTLFGYSADEAVGQSLAQLIIPERYREAHSEGIERFRSSGHDSVQGDVMELFALRSDGLEFPIELAIQGIEADGELFAVGIVRDVTERAESARNLQEAFVETIGAMTNTIATRDPYTADHQRKVSQLSSAIAEELGLPDEVVRGVEFGAMIHDIGKISVPAEILNRPGKLTDIEFEMIKGHSAVGRTIIERIDFPWPIAEIVGQHHERIDGSGYPDGLTGAEISQEARIVAVADVVEAMSSHRPYRPSLGIEAALAEITENRGTSYDSDAVDACLLLFAEDRFEFDAQ